MERAPRCGACDVSDFDRFRRLLAADEAEGRSVAGASGDDEADDDQSPTVWSLEAESMRDVDECTSIDSTPALCPYNSRVGLIVLSSALYFHTRTVRSLPAEAILLSDKHRSDLIADVCPLPSDVANNVPCVASHARIRPSYEPDINWPAEESTSTDPTQSSCSKEEMYVGGRSARTTSTGSVVSAEIPCAVKKSSIVVRRNWPFIRNWRGTRSSEVLRLFTSSERPARRTADLMLF